MKRNYLRIAISLFLVLTMAFSLILTGCGDNKTGETAQNSVKQSESTASESTASESTDTSNGKKTLSGDLELQIFVGGFGDAWWKEMIEAFKKENPGVNVIVNMGPKVNEQMKTRWVSDAPPDFVFVDGPEIPFAQLRDDGKILDLTDWFNTTKTADGSSLIKDKIVDGLIQEYKGKIYSAPMIFGSLGMFYDAKLLRDNNITPPTNFDEFVKLAPVFKEKNIALTTYPGTYPVYLFQGFIQAGLALEGGKQIFDDIEALKPGVFTSEPFLKVMKKVETLAKTDNGIMKGTVALNHTQSQMEWLNRKAAFIPNGLWLENEMKKDIPSDFEMTFIPSLIQDAGQKYAICPYSNSVALSANGKNPENAKAWLEFLYRDNNMKRFTELTGTPTAYVVDLSNANVSTVAKSVAKWLADPNVESIVPKLADEMVNKAMFDGITALVTGKITAEAYCQRVEEASKKSAAEKAAKK